MATGPGVLSARPARAAADYRTGEKAAGISSTSGREGVGAQATIGKESRMTPERFRNRNEAGQQLAEKLEAYANQLDVLVLALPRGGVPVAYEVARALGAPLDVFAVRKLGVPGYEELAPMGAVATGGARVLNDQIVRHLGIPEYVIDAVAAREEQELARRERLYRGGRPHPDVRGRTVILVDDGLATGATMRAAVMASFHKHRGTSRADAIGGH